MSDTNILEFWEESEKASNDLNNARERFRNKGFYHEFKGIRNFSLTFAALIPAISLATGIFYVSDLLGAVVPYWLAVVIGFALIFGWELGKARLLSLCFQMYYKRSKAFVPLCVFCGLFAAGSAFTSLEGAKTAYTKADDKLQLLEASQKAQKDALTFHYDSLIAFQDSAKSAYVKSVSWKGKININNKTTSAVIADHTEEIKRLRGEKTSKLDKQSTTFDAQLQEARENSGYRLGYVITFVAIMELLIIVSNWFPVFFDHKIRHEYDVIQRNLNAESMNVTPSTLTDFVQAHLMPQFAHFVARSHGSHTGTPGSHEQQVGFPVAGSHGSQNGANSPKNTTTTPEIASLQRYLQKHSNVVHAINDGLTPKAVMQKTGVGRTTYYNVKRCIDNLNSAVFLNSDEHNFNLNE